MSEWRTNRRTGKHFRMSRKAPRTTANFYRERLFEPIKGAEYATIVNRGHEIVRMKTPGGEWITQAILHPRTGAEYRKLCRRGKCPITERERSGEGLIPSRSALHSLGSEGL